MDPVFEGVHRLVVSDESRVSLQRAEEMYQARRLSGGQITNRISALLIKAAGTTIQTLTRVSQTPKKPRPQTLNLNFQKP